MKGKVVRCDLRPCGQADGLQEVGNLLSDRSQPDLTLLLVLDTPETLVAHALAYEELWRSRRVGKLLSVLVGPVAAPDVLEIPGSIGPDSDSGVIWVGDADGVDWRLTGSAIAMAHPDSRSGAGLGALLDVLTMPEVFVKTLSLIGGIPGRVASPGLSIFEMAANQTMFLAALSRCIESMLDPAPIEIAARGWSTPLGEPSWAVTTVPSTAVPNGRLAADRDHCTAEAGALTEAVDRLSTAAALYGTGQAGSEALTLAVRAGTELAAYRDAVHALASAPAAERADRFRDWGVRPVPGMSTESDDTASAIVTSLRAGEPLPQIMQRLREYERKLRTGGEFTFSEQIERLCPPTLLQRFTEPTQMSGPEPWLVIVGTVAVAAAASGRGIGIVAGAVVALAWLGLLGLTVARGPRGRLADCRGSLIASGIAALIGLAGGTLLARVLDPPAVAGGIGFLVGACAVAVATTWSWIARTRRWSDSLGVKDVGTAVVELTNVALSAASHEWSADERHQDAVITARAALDGVAVALRAYQEKLDRDLGRDPGRYRSRREFDAYIRRVLCLLIVDALEPVLRGQGVSSPREYELWARSRVSELLAEWDKHVDDHGPLDPPGFACGEEMPDGALGDDDIAAINATLLADPQDLMWQLCRSGDIRLLDTGLPTVPAVRFAPHAVPFEARRTFPAETEWIGFVQRVGVLRLVPLRRGTVRRTWLIGEEDQPVDAEEVS